MKTDSRKTSRVLILIMIAVVIVGIAIAKNYYSQISRSIDPRVKSARELYTRYDLYGQEGDYYRLLALLDSIESIYRNIKHYESSFELGVLYNNRAAALLTISMFADSIPQAYNPYYGFPPDTLVELAEKNIHKAISIYTNWLTIYSGKSSEQTFQILESEFRDGLENYSEDDITRYLNARVNEIEEAIRGNDKRLSVCYANLGIVFRQKGEYVEAVKQYEKALKLWDRNLDAENNLNRLLGKPLKKRNFIQKLFPPKRDG